MQIRQAEQHMQTSLQGIAKRAKEDSKHRFGNLYSLLNEKNLLWCFPQLNKKAAPGVDAVDYDAYEANLAGNIKQMVDDLKVGRYKAKLIRRRYIPKPGGKQRPLGIPTVGDKVLQIAVAQILSAIYEQDFLPCSHGYRRGKGPQRAALELGKRLQHGRCGWVAEADIKGYFENIDHERLIKMLERRINDRKFLGLIRKWLKAGILEEDGRVIYPVTGTPQGGVVSAVLANIYLHYALDMWFEKEVKPRCRGQAMLMRFADDFVCCFQYWGEVRRYNSELRERLRRFNLELSEEKTRTIKFTCFETKDSQHFSFLGFEYYWRKSRKGTSVIKMLTAKDRYRKAIAAILSWIKKECCKLKVAVIFKKLREKLQGHWNYYGVCGNSRMLSRFYTQVCRIMYKWLNRRSQRKSYNWQGFGEMLRYYKIPRPRIIGHW
ncbi:MAG: group II intron reverse transcriptase/maturase [Candidatus Omnitrophota bacterium]|jgi:group II intron reverse transcriptase/maturase